MLSLAVVPAESWGTRVPCCRIISVTHLVRDVGQDVSSHWVLNGRIFFFFFNVGFLIHVEDLPGDHKG